MIVRGVCAWSVCVGVWSWLSPSTFTCHLGTELRSSSLGQMTLSLLSHLAGL